MREYLPVLIVGAMIGFFSVLFLVIYALEKNKKETMGFDRHMPDGEIIKRLLQYAKPYWKTFVAILFIMLFSIFYDLVGPLLIGDLVELVETDFELSKLFTMVGLYAGLLAVSLLCTYIQAMLLQRIGQLIRREGDTLAHVDRSRPVIDPDCEKAHDTSMI